MNLHRSLIVLVSFIICTGSLAQYPQSDTIKTGSGNIIMHPVLHATFAIEYNDLTVYLDPYGGAEKFASLPSPDLVLITDIHGDHLNRETLNALDLQNNKIISCAEVAKQLQVDFSDIRVLNNGESMNWEGITIEAIPMYNLPETSDSRHPKGRGNGYVITIDDKRIYVSGDTEDIPEMRALKNIDAAFICMNLPYTMDVNAAANAVLEFKPKIVYPFHFRGGGGKFSDVKEFSKLVTQENKLIDVRLLKWYDNYE